MWRNGEVDCDGIRVREVEWVLVMEEIRILEEELVDFGMLMGFVEEDVWV